MPSQPPSSHSGSTRRRFLIAIGIAEHDANDVLADPWCQSATDQLLDVVQNAASELAVATLERAGIDGPEDDSGF